MYEKPTFSERLKELIEEKGIKSVELARAIGVAPSSVRYWCEGKYEVYLSNAVKIANYFECSLGYLFGESNDAGKVKPLKEYDFSTRLTEVMEERGISRRKLINETVIKDSHLTNWEKGKDPRIHSVLILVEYLNVSLDYLLRGNY